jgi:hypothetical protein
VLALQLCIKKKMEALREQKIGLERQISDARAGASDVHHLNQSRSLLLMSVRKVS